MFKLLLVATLAIAGVSALSPARNDYRQSNKQYRQPVQQYRQPVQQAQPQYRPIAKTSPIQGGPEQSAETLSRQLNINEDGTYNYAYETSNGISGSESGSGGQYAKGAFSFTSPEGEPVQVQYLADENGYQPQSNLLPTPPPIPAQILKSLEYIRTHPQYQDKHYR